MVEAAIDSGMSLKTGSNLRYFPSVAKAKELLAGEAIGAVTFARAWIGNDGWHCENTWFSDPDLIGGGTMLDNGVHLFDVVRWLLGEVVQCAGLVSTRMWNIEQLEDNGMALLLTDSGAPVSIHSSWSDWHPYMYMEVYGSDGSLKIDNLQPACRVTLTKRTCENVDVFDYSRMPLTSHDDEFADYVRCLRSGWDVRPSGYDGLRAVQLAASVYESARTGRTVSTFSQEDAALRRRASVRQPAGTDTNKIRD